MKPTVIILLSDKRSGSTMFESELCKHPDIKPVKYSPHAYRETHHWLKAACILKAPKQLFYGNRIYRGYGTRQGARQYMIDCIQGNVPEFVVPADDEALVFEGWNALCRQFARPAFFEKSPQHPHHWAALDLMLKWAENDEFDVRFIGLVRNPMAVMYSAQKLFSTDPVQRQFGWAHCYRNILTVKEFMGSDRFHFIRYEDFVSRPAEVLNHVWSFLGVASHKIADTEVHRHSMAKWVDDPAFTFQPHESVIRLARYLGYDEKDLFNPPKPVPVVHEKIFRYLTGEYMLFKSRLVDRYIKPILLKLTHRK